VDGSLRSGPLPIEDLAAEHGTPLFIYSFDSIRDRFRALSETFAAANVLLAYSVKANGNLALLNRLASLGAGADIVSGGELFRALKAGVPPGRIVFGGVGKREDELRAGLEAGILAFNVETS
jgi:diaminopimelate decarboxylase